ncbi:rhomboid family intramembrane serine protease [Tropicimonas sp. IMCC34011]|uniref:rhomboid family intramembrane serine protease n=1 Tax=Tropicimonas sp. IMCC34011 TaxID=2248759 RepID=UPI000E21FF6B|nr:rhomboid family intramembrane serine protease [Tropicimonas sp. IMCC34011]
MFPIRDHNPSGGRPYVVWTLIAANVAIFLMSLGVAQDPMRLAAYYADWALIPALSSPLSFVTSMFLHAGWMHLIGNMLYLWIFGDNLEEEMGHAGFLGFYIAAGVGAGIAHVAAAPYSTVPTVGASGAIAGVMGGYLLLFPKARVDVLFIFVVIFKVIPIPAWIVLLGWFALQLFNSVGSDPMGGGVAYWAHAGGFVIGLALTLPIWLKRGAVAFWSRTHGHPPHEEARYSRSRVPVVRRR